VTKGFPRQALGFTVSLRGIERRDADIPGVSHSAASGRFVERAPASAHLSYAEGDTGIIGSDPPSLTVLIGPS
jgi:hypothetical protein